MAIKQQENGGVDKAAENAEGVYCMIDKVSCDLLGVLDCELWLWTGRDTDMWMKRERERVMNDDG